MEKNYQLLVAMSLVSVIVVVSLAGGILLFLGIGHGSYTVPPYSSFKSIETSLIDNNGNFVFAGDGSEVINNETAQ